MQKRKINANWYCLVIVAMLLYFSARSMWSFAHGDFSKVSDFDSVSSVWNSSVYYEWKLSEIDSLCTYLAIGEIPSVQVLQGKDNWFFYKSTSDGDPIADYEGRSLYTQEQMEKILGTVLKTQNALNDRGIAFALLVPPNKENAYYDYMPEDYTHSEVSRTDILMDYLSANGVNAVSPKNELLNQHLTNQLYYKYDTHWNQLGAYIGVREALKTFGITIDDISYRSIFSEPFTASSCANDDLAGMLGKNPIYSFDDEIEYKVDGTVSVDWEVFRQEQDKEKRVSHFYNPNAKNNSSLLLVGDSFRTAMIPALSEVFADVYVIHRSNYKSTLLDELKPDYLIAEYVERYSNDISSIDKLVK